MARQVQPSIISWDELPVTAGFSTAVVLPDVDSLDDPTHEPDDVHVEPVIPYGTFTPGETADVDTRSPESVLATRTNIVSDGPGTVGY